MALPINPEKWTPLKPAAKFVAVPVTYSEQVEQPTTAANGYAVIELRKLASLGEKTCPNTTVINAHSNEPTEWS